MTPAAEVTQLRVRTEPNYRRVRVFFGGQPVADSSRTLYLFETGHLPVYYFPRADVRFDLLEPTAKHTHCPYKGDASYYTVAAGGRRYEDAVWAYPEPIESVPRLADYVAFYWNQADAWYEEDDEVFKHPRDPYHRVDVLHSSRHVQVRVGGVLVADSSRPRLLFETGLPVRYYLPKLDVRTELLVPSPTRTRCPYKGEAVYWSVRAGEDFAEDIVWSYPAPIPEAPKIENLPQGELLMTYSIPVIDLEAATRGDAPRDLLDQVQAATEETGILQLVNHGVPEELISGFGSRVGRLLGLPRAQKAELASPTGHPYRGWRQWPDDFGRLELERFNVGQFDNAADARAAGLAEEYLGVYAHANVWPADDPGLRDLTHRYIAASRTVAERVLGLYAVAQGLPADTFPVGPLPYLTLTVNNYPTWTYEDTGRDEDKLLLLEHADGTAVTILAQQGDYEGLQVQLPDGDWLPVPIIPGALQVFSGTLLTRWSNGLLRPARHRVVAGGAVTRRSTAVFYYPGLDRVLEPLPAFTEPGEETDFEPVTGWDLVKDNVENYLKVFGRPEQVTAWREGRPYIAELAENSAGR